MEIYFQLHEAYLRYDHEFLVRSVSPTPIMRPTEKPPVLRLYSTIYPRIIKMLYLE